MRSLYAANAACNAPTAALSRAGAAAASRSYNRSKQNSRHQVRSSSKFDAFTVQKTENLIMIHVHAQLAVAIMYCGLREAFKVPDKVQCQVTSDYNYAWHQTKNGTASSPFLARTNLMVSCVKHKLRKAHQMHLVA
jgi:hypothetical protein